MPRTATPTPPCWPPPTPPSWSRRASPRPPTSSTPSTSARAAPSTCSCRCCTRRRSWRTAPSSRRSVRRCWRRRPRPSPSSTTRPTAYQAVQAVGVPVPPWWRVRTEEELVAAVEELEAAGHKACFKPAAGAGGVGFRVITRAPFSLAHLNGFPSPYVPLDLVVEALRAADEPVDWLVMPRLEQPEVSVDCLTGAGRPGPDGDRPHEERPAPRLHAARCVDRARAAARGGVRAALPVQHPVPDVRRRPGAHGRQHPPGGRTAPALPVRRQRPLGGGAVGARRGRRARWCRRSSGRTTRWSSGPAPVRPVSLPQQRTDAPVSAAARRARPAPRRPLRLGARARQRPRLQRDHGRHRRRLSLRPRSPVAPLVPPHPRSPVWTNPAQSS